MELTYANPSFPGHIFSHHLWNQFFSTAAVPHKQTGYGEVVYAFKAFQSKSTMLLLIGVDDIGIKMTIVIRSWSRHDESQKLFLIVPPMGRDITVSYMNLGSRRDEAQNLFLVVPPIGRNITDRYMNFMLFSRE